MRATAERDEIRSGDGQPAAWPQDPGTFVDEGLRIEDMLDDLRSNNRCETFALKRERCLDLCPHAREPAGIRSTQRTRRDVDTRESVPGEDRRNELTVVTADVEYAALRMIAQQRAQAGCASRIEARGSPRVREARLRKRLARPDSYPLAPCVLAR